MFDPRLESKLFQFYKQFCCLKKKVDESSGGGSIVFPQVENYSLLPGAPENTGAIYLVLNSQGTWWLPWNLGGNYYPKGLYYSNGVDWIFTKDIPYQATQAEVNTGTVNDKFVTPLTLENALKWATKANASHTHSQSEISGLVSDLAGKQETLVSGTNIKTINGNSILGSGDLPISGGNSVWGQLRFTTSGSVISASANTDTIISFGTNEGAGTTRTNTRITIDEDGSYEVSYFLNALPTLAGVYELRLYLNGAEQAYARAIHRQASNGFHTSLGNSLVLNLVAGNYIELYFRANAGVAMGTGNAVLKVVKI